MTPPDVLERVRGIRPEVPADTSADASARTNELLDRILASEPVSAPPRRVFRPASGIATAIALIVVMTGLLVVPGGSTATARVRHAAQATADLGSGRATMQVIGQLDGKPNNGTVELEWNGADESYVFDYPQQAVKFETRVIAGRAQQRVGNDGWTDLGTQHQLSTSGKLAQTSTSLERLGSEIDFRLIGTESGLRHFKAHGDLSPLDSSDTGFVFGTNGARDAQTTSLEVWLADDGLIRRVRTTFQGTPEGHTLKAEATTELRDLGTPITIADPQQ